MGKYKKNPDMWQEGSNNIFWYYLPKYTNYLDTTDKFSENHINFWFVVYLYEWLWYSDNMKLLE